MPIVPVPRQVSPRSSTFRPVVIAPTYNNATTLIGILERIERVGIPLIVVDDGATDETPALLAEWERKRHEVSIHVITHSENKGKAAALMTGFAQAKRLEFTHAVTIDTDGQLEPDEIPTLLDAASAIPDALVLGRRDENTPGLPRSNLIGWYTSGLGVWVETGVVVHDSQCGLRVYPLQLFDVVRCRAGRFGFEAEIIARAVWAGCPLVDVPVSCHYPEREKYVSHLKPWRDGAKGFFMHWGLAIRRLIPWPEPKFVGQGTSRDEGESGVGRTPKTGWPAWRQWASPFALWNQIRSSRLEQLIASAGFGFGAFLACLPLGPWAFAVAAYGSKRLHHNLWLALLGATLSTSPIGRSLAMTAIAIVYVPTHGAFPDFPGTTGGAQFVGPLLRTYPISWCVGGVVLGTIVHWLAIAGMMWGLRSIKARGR